MSNQNFVVDGRLYPLSQVDVAVNDWLSGGGAQDAFLIYVHGKGKEPEKTRDVLQEMVPHYRVRVLVLNWEDSEGLFPREAAEAAGPALVSLLGHLQVRPRQDKPLVLLTQSMGNFSTEYLGQAVERGEFNLAPALLATVVLNAPAVNGTYHRRWLEPLAACAPTFVVANDHDRVLRTAEIGPPRPLGRKLERFDLARKVVYLDLSGYHRKFHRYFKPNDGIETIPPKLGAFYDAVLRGEAPDFGTIPLQRGQIRLMN